MRRKSLLERKAAANAEEPALAVCIAIQTICGRAEPDIASGQHCHCSGLRVMTLRQAATNQVWCCIKDLHVSMPRHDCSWACLRAVAGLGRGGSSGHSLVGVLLREVQWVPLDALIHVQDIIGGGLKVRGGIVSPRDEAPVLFAIGEGLVQVADLHKFLVNDAQQSQACK